MYSFNPVEDSAPRSFSLIPDGIYDFEIVSSSRRTSKAGNPMAAVQLLVHGKNGETRMVFDYLVFSKVILNIRKVKHFCESVGLQEQYNRGQMTENLQGLSGKVQIGSQDEQAKPGGGFYPKKNIVVDYIKTDKVAVKNDAVPAANIDKRFGDVPF